MPVFVVFTETDAETAVSALLEDFGSCAMWFGKRELERGVNSFFGGGVSLEFEVASFGGGWGVHKILEMVRKC